MRKRRVRRELAALGEDPFEPSEEQRSLVRTLALNDTPVERIAYILELSQVQVTYWFARELDLAKDAFITIATDRVIALIKQERDPGVALRASELLLKTRSRSWRVPSDEAQEGKPVERMTLTEVDDAIARLERQRRDAAAAAHEEEAAPHQQGKPH